MGTMPDLIFVREGGSEIRKFHAPQPAADVLNALRRNGRNGDLFDEDGVQILRGDSLGAGYYTFEQDDAPSTTTPTLPPGLARRWKEMRFDLKECDMLNWVAGSLVPTDNISKVMENFGGFPSGYYVRREEMMLFEIIRSGWQDSLGKNLPGALGKQKITILGSPGVGKSAFMVMLAFYLARCCSQSVLLLRKLKGDETCKCVFLSQYCYSEVKFTTLDDMILICKQLLVQWPAHWYFVDGFMEDDIRLNHGALSPYKLLATSSQFRRKSDDPTIPVVLPAWQFCDLADFAEQT